MISFILLYYWVTKSTEDAQAVLRNLLLKGRFCSIKSCSILCVILHPKSEECSLLCIY